MALAHIRKSRPDSGLGCQVEILQTFPDVACSRGSATANGSISWWLNRLIDLYRNSPESSDLRCRSRQLNRTIGSLYEGWEYLDAIPPTKDPEPTSPSHSLHKRPFVGVSHARSSSRLLAFVGIFRQSRQYLQPLTFEIPSRRAGRG